MSSTYSTSLQIQLIATGEQSGVWGAGTNTNWNLIEQAVAGVQAITMTNADYTLSVLNGVSDEARNAVLVVNGTNSDIRKIIAPLVSKVYVVYNNTTGGYAITIGGSTGSTVSIPNGVSTLVYCDGTNFYQGISGTSGNLNAAAFYGAGTGLTGSAASLNAGGLVGGAANRFPYQSGTNTTTFLAAPTTAGTGIVWDGTSLGWGIIGGAVASGAIYENSQVITANYTMTTGKNGESVGPITINGGVTVTIPTGSTWLVL